MSQNVYARLTRWVVLWTAWGLAGVLLLSLTHFLNDGLFPRVAHAQESVGTYTVAPGDTLGLIAERFGVSVEALTDLNNIADPNVIVAGQALLIPESTSAAASGLGAIETALVYAQPGDILADVALRHGVDVPILVALNQMSETAHLFPIQSVRLPAAQQPAPLLRFGAIRRVEFTRQIEQGKTGRLFVEARAHVTPTATWNGLPLAFTRLNAPPIVSQTNPVAVYNYALLPVPALIAPAAYELSLAYPGRNGVKLRRTWSIAVVEGAYNSQEILLPPEKGELLEPERVEAELEKLTAVWSQNSAYPRWLDRFARPVAEQYATTSPFGTRRSYNGGPVASYHAGQDFGAPEGVTVTVPAAGVVVLAEPLDVRGNAVVIDHGRGVFTGYWHLSEIKVAVEQEVVQGDVLGLVGTTGLSTGAHLHWEMRIYGIAVDPMQFLSEPLVKR